jgi:hypothetical protein
MISLTVMRIILNIDCIQIDIRTEYIDNLISLFFFYPRRSIKNGVCLRPHGRSENILKKCSYELYTIIIKFFNLPSNHNLL